MFMSRISTNKNKVQFILDKAGRDKLGDRANVLPDHKVRQAGAKRLGGVLLLAATTLGVGGNAVNNAIDHQVERNRDVSHEVKHKLDEMDAQKAIQDVQNFKIQNPTASEAEINAYLESDQNPSQPGVQTEQSDK